MTFNIHTEPEWEKIVERLLIDKGIVFLLGATDSGKSTFAKFLINRLVLKGLKTCLVDADIGQSTIGLPGTISLKNFIELGDLEKYYFEKMFFVGTTNPLKRLNLMIHGTKKMVEVGRERSEIIVVDTTGLISGEEGKTLKTEKIKAIKPNHIIAFQRKEELEHILSSIDAISIFRLKISSMVKVRDKEQRFKYRQAKFESYFNRKKISEFILGLRDTSFYFPNGQKRLDQINSKKNFLIGLNIDEDTIALGIVTEITKNSIQFLSPIASINEINKVIFGDINVILER
ncbi:MAG: polynucleotide 5'-hydroxyl-kinase [Thermodesulfovibrionales bacterium]|nr:polynucleotide 5'-hydroxyl-kinase [Thermodesulfovibrionales bacterium]